MSKTLRAQVLEMTDDKVRPVIDNVYRESLRAMLSEFGNLHYIDGNSNKIKVKCVYGNPERIAGRLKADNTLILPMVTIVETQTLNDDNRRRYNPVLVNEKYWDEEELRAKRIVSLSPRPVIISYEINLWCKYKADLDMLRSTIFSKFNPDIQLTTEFTRINKVFLEAESDVGAVAVQDSEDRVLQKTIRVNLETYIDNPKFLLTNTGEIKEMNFVTTIEE
tara:strand:- start:584 stop:1246 length:663 start_codon:yes stop_codon:yes gene_type:complete